MVVGTAKKEGTILHVLLQREAMVTGVRKLWKQSHLEPQYISGSWPR